LSLSSAKAVPARQRPEKSNLIIMGKQAIGDDAN
jgi:electron transfer flavoprotein alpha/beta subunit